MVPDLISFMVPEWTFDIEVQAPIGEVRIWVKIPTEFFEVVCCHLLNPIPTTKKTYVNYHPWAESAHV